MENKPKKASWGNPIIYIAAVLIAFVVMMYEKKVQAQTGLSALATIPLSWLMMIVFFFIGMIMHSVGRLVTGLISGYETLLFSAGPFARVRRNGRLVPIKLPTSYKLGQCMMKPKEKNREKYFWYYFGGPFFNILGAALALAVMLLSKNAVISWVMSAALLSMTTLALVYLIPSDSGAPNDGMMIKRLKSNVSARRAQNNILFMAGLEMDGTRSSEMPEELFEGVDAGGASPFCDLAVLKASQLIDRGDNSDAEKLLGVLINNESVAKISVYDMTVRCDLSFILIMQGRFERIDEITSPELIKRINIALPHNISKLKFLYAYYLLFKKDSAKAEGVYSQAMKLRESCLSLAEYDEEIAIMNAVKEKAVSFPH